MSIHLPQIPTLNLYSIRKWLKTGLWNKSALSSNCHSVTNWFYISISSSIHGDTNWIYFKDYFINRAKPISCQSISQLFSTEITNYSYHKHHSLYIFVLLIHMHVYINSTLLLYFKTLYQWYHTIAIILQFAFSLDLYL